MEIKSNFIVHLTDNFHNGGQQTVEQVRTYFESIKNEVAEGVRSRMREFTGEEKGSVETLVSGTEEISLRVWSDLPQAYVDEFGQEPGSPGGARQHWPPFGPASTLFAWVVAIINPQPRPRISKRKGKGKPKFTSGGSLFSVQKSVTWLVARAINDRGLPGPGDSLHAPFATTRAAMLPQIQQGLSAIGASVAEYVNG